MTALAAALWISPALPARAEITDRIVANVNGAIILLSEVRDQQAILAELREKQGLGLPDEELTESRVLSNMIDEKLAASFAKEKEIEIKEAEVDKAIANIKEKNKIGDDEFRSAIVAQGSTMEKFREQVKNQLLIQRVISMEVDMVNPSEDDAKAFYQQNRSLFVAQGRIKARHILIMVPEDASPAETAQAASRIEEIKKQIDQGADFAQMASQYSADPSAKNGGELGWLKKGEVVPSFEQAAFALEAGQVSGPVLTQFGYHLIQVTEKEQAEPAPYEKVADAIKDRLSQVMFEAKRKDWLASIREQAFIEILY